MKPLNKRATSKFFLLSVLLLVAFTTLSGCSKYTGTYGDGARRPYVYVKSDKISIIAKTGSSWDTHEGRIDKVEVSKDGKTVAIKGTLVYGRGHTRATYEAGLTSSKEEYDTYPFSANVDTAKKQIDITATLRYAGSLYQFNETLKKQ
jgi:hypothetical protein